MIDLRFNAVTSQGKTRRTSLVPIAFRGQTTGRSLLALFLVTGLTALLVATRMFNAATLPTSVEIPFVFVVAGFVLG